MSVCADCAARFVGCHGKNPDGTWRCAAWGEEQTRRTARRDESRGQWLKAAVGRSYTNESIRRRELRRQRGR